MYQIVPFESKKGVRVAEGNNLNLLKSDFVRSPPKLNRTSRIIFCRIWNVAASNFGLDKRFTFCFYDFPKYFLSKCQNPDSV